MKNTHQVERNPQGKEGTIIISQSGLNITSILYEAYTMFTDTGCVVQRTKNMTKHSGLKGRLKERISHPYTKGATGYLMIVPSEMISIDVDVGGDKKGQESIVKLFDDLGFKKGDKNYPIPTTKTQSGGLHYFFNMPEKLQGMVPDISKLRKKYPNLDIYSDYQTVHPIAGTRYKNEKGEIKQYLWATDKKLVLNTFPDTGLMQQVLMLKEHGLCHSNGKDYSNIDELAEAIIADDMPLEEVNELLSKIDPNDMDYDSGWLNIGFAMYDRFSGTEEGLQKFLEWSSRNKEKHDEDYTTNKWNSGHFAPDKITYKHLRYIVKPFKQKPNIDEVLEMIHQLVKFSSKDLQDVLKNIAHLDSIDRDSALHQLQDKAKSSNVKLNLSSLREAVSIKKNTLDNEEDIDINEFSDLYPVMVGNSMKIMYWVERPWVKNKKEYKSKEFIVTNHLEMAKYYTGNQSIHFLKWWKHPKRPTYNGVVFNPEASIILGDYVNLWNGYSCKPKKGDISLFIDLLENVICSGDKEQIKYLKGYLAHQFQQPTEKPGVAVVYKGPKGIGKDTFIDAIGNLYNDAYLSISTKSQLVGNFNSHLANIMMVSSAEQTFAGSHAEDGVLKNLITNPQLAIEKKGIDVFNLPSYVRVHMSSNEDWVVPATGKERRYFVPTISNHRQQDTIYFGKFHKWYDNGGKEAILYWLLNYDIEGFDIRKYPETNASIEQKVLTLEPWEIALINYVFEYNKAIFVMSSGDLLQILDEPKYNKYHTNAQSLGIKLKKVFGASIKIRGGTARGWQDSIKNIKKKVEDYIGIPNLFETWDNGSHAYEPDDFKEF